MPAYVRSRRSWARSWSPSSAGTCARGLPSHLATILLFDPDTGALMAVMDGRYITEARTAAVSAVSAKALARPDATSAGDPRHRRAGPQPPRGAASRCGRSHDVRVWSPQARSRDRFVADMAGKVGGTVRAVRCRPRRPSAAPTSSCWSPRRRHRSSTTRGWPPGTHVDLGGRLPPRSARDGADAGRTRAAGGRLAGRGAGRIGRRRAGDSRGPLRARRTSSESWAKCCSAGWPGGATPTR